MYNEASYSSENLRAERVPNPIVSSDRLVFLMLISFGFYAFVWLYRNWHCFRGSIWPETIRPGLRVLGVFVPVLGLILIYKQFKNINQYLQDNQMSAPFYSPGLLSFGFYLILGLHRFSDRVEQLEIGVPAVVLVFTYTIVILLLEIIPLMVFQNTLNTWWRYKGFEIPTSYKMGLVELGLSIFGSLLWLLSLMGLFSSLLTPETVF